MALRPTFLFQVLLQLAIVGALVGTAHVFLAVEFTDGRAVMLVALMAGLLWIERELGLVSVPVSAMLNRKYPSIARSNSILRKLLFKVQQ